MLHCDHGVAVQYYTPYFPSSRRFHKIPQKHQAQDELGRKSGIEYCTRINRDESKGVSVGPQGVFGCQCPK